MQNLIGSCKIEDIAVAVYCPVVSLYPNRNELIIFGGGVHLSKEKTNWQGKEIFGFVAKPDDKGFGTLITNAFVKSLSQEHGVVVLPTDVLNKIKLGDLLAVLPVHSCMSVDLNSSLLSLDGEIIPKFRTF